MTSFLSFHAAATARGDGLRPELFVLLARADSRSNLTSRPDGMLQSGPDPASADGARINRADLGPAAVVACHGVPAGVDRR
jgi:hypothetical protein